MSAPTTSDAAAGDLYAGVVGQDRAVAQLRAAAAAPVHAYLLVGPAGTGKLDAARAFAAALLCDGGGCGACRTCRLALAGEHPDVEVIVPDKSIISAELARDIRHRASLSPVEGRRKVLVLTEFHAVDRAAPVLLKTVEEPPLTTVFLILAERTPPELVTIASRCCRVDFGPVPEAVLVERLLTEGCDPSRAEVAARAAGGSLARARLLATDERVVGRTSTWRQLPARLDGTGAAAAALASELLELIEAAAGPLREGQAREVVELEERIERTGERGGGRKDLQARHKREERRHRTDELRSGLAVLAGRYRDALAGASDPGPLLAAIERVNAAAADLVRNPNEALLLQALLLGLPSLPNDTGG